MYMYCYHLIQEAQLSTSTEVEFTVQSDYTNERQHAVRIVLLPALTVHFEIIHNELVTGTVKEELPVDTSRNRPNVLRIQKYIYHYFINLFIYLY